MIIIMIIIFDIADNLKKKTVVKTLSENVFEADVVYKFKLNIRFICYE